MKDQVFISTSFSVLQMFGGRMAFFKRHNFDVPADEPKLFEASQRRRTSSGLLGNQENALLKPRSEERGNICQIFFGLDEEEVNVGYMV